VVTIHPHGSLWVHSEAWVVKVAFCISVRAECDYSSGEGGGAGVATGNVNMLK
jgi:hypothetical protein